MNAPTYACRYVLVYNHPMAPITAFMLLTFLSYISVACIRRLALRYEILDKPTERSSHSIPMPRGGGFAIVFLVLAVSVGAANQVDKNRSIMYFMDGIDGLAGGVGLSAGIGWMWLASNMHNSFAFWGALAIAAGSLGFLRQNWSPQGFFMGDVGSTFLGYRFAILPLIWVLLSVHAARLRGAKLATKPLISDS
jgi:UDP-N-acetylmuramyl pentapeptide phosphotransferase/UDP-N-acetylglucosamine-1-phosphate transferase